MIEKLDVQMEKYTLIRNSHNTKINLKLLKDLNLEANSIKFTEAFVIFLLPFFKENTERISHKKINCIEYIKLKTSAYQTHSIVDE
jgi:hypothetical protein